MAKPTRRGLGREAPVLLPISLLLFAALATITLLSYRAAVANLIAERQDWTLRQARTIAERAAGTGESARAELSARLPAGVAAAIHDAGGRQRWSFGFADPETASRPLPAGVSFDSAVVLGPDAEIGDRVAAFVPYSPPGRVTAAGARTERWLLRLESPEPGLGAVRRSLRILTPVVFGLSAAVAIVAILFFRALTRPLTQLLARAKESPALRNATEGDDIDLLLATFDRALAALRASDGDPTGATRKDAEARLAESVAQLGELSAGVAHELRNSLATIQGYVGLLERRELAAPAREELLELKHEAAALGRVVDDFLAFARPDVRQFDRVDLGALLERALADPALGGATFAPRPAGAPVEIAADERLLQRALRNLLQNAVEAQRDALQPSALPPRPVEIRLSSFQGRAEVTIRDHGAGIAPEIAGHLFQPFASHRPGGAGLGLALARRIVLLHGGSLTLESHPEGGAVATMRLPLGDSATIGNG